LLHNTIYRLAAYVHVEEKSGLRQALGQSVKRIKRMGGHRRQAFLVSHTGKHDISVIGRLRICHDDPCDGSTMRTNSQRSSCPYSVYATNDTPISQLRAAATS
jgi:hypothetical protein